VVVGLDGAAAFVAVVVLEFADEAGAAGVDEEAFGGEEGGDVFDPFFDVMGGADGIDVGCPEAGCQFSGGWVEVGSGWFGVAGEGELDVLFGDGVGRVEFVEDVEGPVEVLGEEDTAWVFSGEAVVDSPEDGDVRVTFCGFRDVGVDVEVGIDEAGDFDEFAFELLASQFGGIVLAQAFDETFWGVGVFLCADVDNLEGLWPWGIDELVDPVAPAAGRAGEPEGTEGVGLGRVTEPG